MALRLTIENLANLPDGGPISFAVDGERPVDIGRDKHVDWTLPDPTRYISGKHCEIRYRDNSYWLHDVSTNGTFLNGAAHRMRSPYQLKDGDRLIIGHYIIAVSLDRPEGSHVQRALPQTSSAARPASDADVWASGTPAVSPSPAANDARAPRSAAPAQSAFADWTSSGAGADSSAVRPRALTGQNDDSAGMDWTGSDPFGVQRTSDPHAVAARDQAARIDHPAPAESVAPPATSPFAVPKPQGGSPASAAAAQAESPPTASPAVETGVRPQGAGQSLASIIARGAAVPESTFANRDEDQLAHELGELMRMSIINLMILLQARNEAKRLTRSRSHTTVEATENNPLKFAPSPEEAMRILFGPRNRAYLGARAALEQGYNDLRTHQQRTYAAMRHAISMLMAELDPAAIARQAQDQESMLDKVRSQKGRLWDTLVARWNASFGREASAPVDAFMQHFADHYDEAHRQ
ncbi:type VI secretion system-associated FHA domain protein TagH [Bradyrhizobium sp. STM 3557]|uniref:type VI secretion system-associated FHA domain protein TagH n=1 Tax=Bradyrhizobium sp. STM 3557 TaxID=578920 RepID=UPI00388EF4C5